MLGAGNPVGGQGIVNVRGQLHLDSRSTGLDAVGGAVVQGDPVGKDTMGVQPLD